MNITEFMSFDLEWFMTLPGILITGGVVVLLIALIIFIASNKKSKNNGPEVVEANNNGVVSTPDVALENNVNDVVMPSAMNNDMSVSNTATFGVNESPVMNNGFNSVETPVVNEMPVVSEVPSTPVVPQVTNVVDFSAPVQPTVAEPVSIPNVVENNSNIPAVGAQPANEATVMMPKEEVPFVPEVNNLPAVEQGEINIPAVNEVVLDAAPVAPEKPVIYGGVDPINTVSAAMPEKPVIYGGADPLENTTTNLVINHDAYNASSPAPVENVVASVAPETTATDNFVEPTVPVVPTVDVQPEVSVEPSSMPATGAEMFGSIENEVSTESASDNEIETLEF